jgi:hypothetical protein
LTSHPLRNVFEAMMEKGQDYRWGVLDDGTVNYG